MFVLIVIVLIAVVLAAINNVANMSREERFYFSIFMIAVMMGFYFESWYVFGLILVILSVAAQVKEILLAVQISIVIGWAVAGYLLGVWFFSTSAGVVIGGLCALVGVATAFELKDPEGEYNEE